MEQKSSFNSLQELFAMPRAGFSDAVKDINSDANDANILKLIHEARVALEKLEQTLQRPLNKTGASQPINQSSNQPTIDGVFDGQNMVSEDGTIHLVPENYASKSRLLEGDLLQLLGERYKQISRVPRKSTEAKLKEVREKFGIAVTSDGNLYQISPAAVRFFRASVGDILTLEIPEENGAIWAAVVSKNESCYTRTRYASNI